MAVDIKSHKRILLLYPEVPRTTYWSFSFALHIINKRAVQPPLGLLTVAGLIPESYELRLRDLNIESCSDEDIRWADVIFVSAMIVQKESFKQCVKKANHFDVPVVAGGPYPTTNFSEIHGVAHFVLGEAEDILPFLLSDLEAGLAKKVYARPTRADETKKILDYFGSDADVITATAAVCLDDSPLPRFDMLDLDAYRAMAIQTSRGCPHGCEFCGIWRRFGRKMRYKSITSVIAELNSLYNLGWRGSVFIVDDNFVGNSTQVKHLLKAISEWQKQRNYPFELSTEASINLADDNELLLLMQMSGFDMVFVGLETPAEENLREAGKGVNISGCMGDKVRRIQDAGIIVSSGFIMGFDHDPEDIAERMIKYIHDLGIPMAMVGLLQAIPDTDLYDRLKNEGRLVRSSDGNNTHEFSLSFMPRRPAEKLISDYKKVLQVLYPVDLKSYFQRCVRLRHSWKATNFTTAAICWQEVKCFLRYFTGSLFTAYAWNSVCFLTGTLFKKPNFFPSAVSLAIQGHHFREITHIALRLEDLKQSYAELANQFVDRIRFEHKKLSQDFSILVQDGNDSFIKRTDAALCTIDKYRQSIQHDAFCRAKKLSGSSRQAALDIYVGLCNKLSQTLSDFQSNITTSFALYYDDTMPRTEEN